MRVTVSAQHDTRKLLALAVDDEQPGMDVLKRCLENNPHIERVRTAVDASEALRVISADDEEVQRRREHGLPPVDVVFADLQMPGLSGMEMARVFTALNPAPLLVFVTGYSEEAVQAFDLGAVDYVLKPYNQDRLNRSIERVLSMLHPGRPEEPARNGPSQEDSEVVPVELAGTTKLIPRNKVRWVEAHGDYVRLHTKGGSYLARTPLTQLEEHWAGAGFVRIHRSYLVALREITEIRMSQGSYQVVIGEGEKLLPVSRRNARNLKDRITRRGG
ncbi:LytTR family DNA-binding domain-containing protein [Haloechinothrix sp. LS1_15]|uniref:LytR/AlgR family response regulator transcription factor n=1 Tax=Haloechinothrix sp. LS1_15 TaxID=2652248 RepID=UPI00294543D6|nr:LytTR family DNA-binding domain-containing protein [Haloechinothrix sp. LS1_15]MDV6014540.1 response regulator transcription factor [Haloechinothrix sp. LS1_15]